MCAWKELQKWIEKVVNKESHHQVVLNLYEFQFEKKVDMQFL